MIKRLLERLDQRSRLFGDMLARFSFDIQRDLTMGDAMALSQAITRCRGCGATERCESWMSSTTGTEGAEQFCPNVKVFRQIGGSSIS
jgi:hypothetical protein